MNEQHQDFAEAAYRQMAVNLLKELAELHKQGILTDEEFAAKKKDLLDKI